ncbi:MAG: ZIP family metal transporter [Pseudomonadota bacterium]
MHSHVDLLNEPAFLASILAAVLAALGVVVSAFNTDWAVRQRNAVIAFASGILIGTAVMHLIPEALSVSENGALLILLGYLFFFVLDETAHAGVRNGQERDARAFLVAPLVGIAIHSFVDGLEYPILFEHDLFTGLLAASGLILHEFAEGVIVFALMRTAGVGNLIAVTAALVLAAATTPLGAFTALTFTRLMSEAALGSLMAATAGALLYVGATHLPRQIDRNQFGGSVFLFLLGLAIAGALSLSHGAEDGHIH